MLGVAVAALTSCTQSELVEMPENSKINFSTYVENASRAAEDNSRNVDMSMTEFHVFGAYRKIATATETETEGTNSTGTFTTVFNNRQVSKPEGSTKWSYEAPVEHWNKSSLYRFAAYANGTDGAHLQTDAALDNYVEYNPEDGQDKLYLTNYTASQNDLVAAITSNIEVGEQVTNPTVSFTFDHMLSRVEFVFYSNTVTELHVKNIKINKAVNKASGTLTFGNTVPAWPLEGTTVVSEAAYSEATESGKLLPSTAARYVFFVIPQPNTNAELEFDLISTDATDGRKRTETYKASLSTANLTDGAKWKAGFAYRYVTIFGEHYELTPIEFNVTGVNSWQTDKDKEQGISLQPEIVVETPATPSN